MPLYVYGCPDKEHPRIEVKHRINDETVYNCKDCGEVMHRIPQTFTWGRNPGQVLLEYMDDKYREWRTKKNDNRKRARGISKVAK